MIEYRVHCRGCHRRFSIGLLSAGELNTELLRHTCPTGHAFLKDGMQARAADFWEILGVKAERRLDTKVLPDDTTRTRRKEIE